MDEILDRIERETGVTGLVSLLGTRLSPTDLQSLLLEVYRVRAKRRTPADLLSDYGTSRYVFPRANPDEDGLPGIGGRRLHAQGHRAPPALVAFDGGRPDDRGRVPG